MPALLRRHGGRRTRRSKPPAAVLAMLPSDLQIADARRAIADFNPWQSPMDPGMHAWEAAVLAENQHRAAQVLDKALRRAESGHEAFLRSHGELPWQPGGSK